MIPPTLEEVLHYCKTHDLNIDGAHIYNEMCRKKWRNGGQKIKNWKKSLQALSKQSSKKEPKVLNKEVKVLNKPVEPVNREKNLPIEHRAPKEDRRFWPEDKPFPKVLHVRQNPCPKCRRIYLDDGGQNSVTTSTRGVISFHRCKSCGHRWKMGREKIL